MKKILNQANLKVNLKNGFLNLEPGEIVEAGNIQLLDNKIISYPVVVGNPAFVEDIRYNSSNTQEGIMIISELIIELEDMQEVIEYREKPRILLHIGGVLQFIMQPTTYLLGKTQIPLEWEFSTRPVPLRTILRVG